jgi:2-C-methyl-D-erythritol 2,4-cyclodiphosphate synthase
MAQQKIRIGQGFDVHPFEEGRRCVLGGVEIPSSKGLAGHSDADVLVHALMDALLGAIGESDIGVHFPNTDQSLSGADSCILLSKVYNLLSERGWHLINVDITVLAEKPKLSPYTKEMKEKLAPILSITPEDISIKATTTERLGFVGREEGIAALAVVLISSNNSA